MTRRSALALAGSAALAALALSPPRPARAEFAHQTGFGVDIMPRSTWAGDDLPFLGTPQAEDVRFLLVHHTAGPSSGDPVQIMRGIYAFHTSSEKGWPDVAYNFFIDPAGTVYEARTGSLNNAVQASATGGNQGFAQLVCLLGDFTSQNPTSAALTSLNATLAWLADRYGLDTSSGATATFTSRGSNRWPSGTEVTAAIVSGHRDMSQTACPGDTFYPYLVANVQSQVNALRGNSTSTASTTPSVPEPDSPDPDASDPDAVGDAPPPTDPPPPRRTTTTSSTSSTTTTSTAPSDSTVASSSSAPPSSAVDSTAPATVAPPPDPSSADGRGADAGRGPAESASTVTGSDGRSSANGTAVAVGAAALAMIGGAAAYVGLRGRATDASVPADEPGAGG